MPTLAFLKYCEGETKPTFDSMIWFDSQISKLRILIDLQRLCDECFLIGGVKLTKKSVDIGLQDRIPIELTI